MVSVLVQSVNYFVRFTIFHEAHNPRRGEKIVDLPSYELVNSNTAPKSFCSNLYLRGVDTEVIMALSGHELKHLMVASVVLRINCIKCHACDSLVGGFVSILYCTKTGS
jgi:hypothetical protein